MPIERIENKNNTFIHANYVNRRCWKHGKILGIIRQPSEIINK